MKKSSLKFKIQKTRKRIKSLTRTQIVLAGAMLLLAACSVFFGIKYNMARQDAIRLSDPIESAKVESIQIVGKVGKLVEIPKDESPTITTVSDIGLLKNQPFFAKAANGDKVLVYTKAKMAIMYRPSTNKIIEIAPVNIGSDTTN